MWGVRPIRPIRPTRPRSPDITAPARLPQSGPQTRTHRAKRGDGELLRDQILDQTERLISESGDADRVSIRMVAEAVGRTPPSIYLHFDTKDELIHAVCQRRFDELAGRFTTDLEGIDDPVERIAVMARSYVGFATDNPEQYRVLFMANTRHHGSDEIDQLALVDCFGMLLDAVQAAIDTGRFEPGDPLLMSLSMWATVHGIASLSISQAMGETWPSLDEQVERGITQNLHGLLKR